jgi:hypothetical protein
MELLDMLKEKLGVSDSQAEGGAGLVFELAREKLDDADFARVSAAMPGIQTLMATAPPAGEALPGGLSGMVSGLGTGGGILSMANLAAGFSTMGLDAKMTTKFVNTILAYLHSKGESGAASILEKLFE